MISAKPRPSLPCWSQPNRLADIETFAHRDGVWIVQRHYARDLASLLRYSLIAVYAERANQAGKDEKMEILYGYLTSIEFQHRVQAIVEGFSNLLAGIEQEKRQFRTNGRGRKKRCARSSITPLACTATCRRSPAARCRPLPPSNCRR